MQFNGTWLTKQKGFWAFAKHFQKSSKVTPVFENVMRRRHFHNVLQACNQLFFYCGGAGNNDQVDSSRSAVLYPDTRLESRPGPFHSQQTPSFTSHATGRLKCWNSSLGYIIGEHVTLNYRDNRSLTQFKSTGISMHLGQFQMWRLHICWTCNIELFMDNISDSNRLWLVMLLRQFSKWG
jgi:hypothetical protein